MSGKILITGASGLIGSKLSDSLSKNHSIVHLGRTKRSGRFPSFIWNVEKQEIDPQALDEVETIIHLAGANVGDKRWTAPWKKEILNSRIQSTQLLFDSLKNKPNSIRTFVSASAIGYYGFEGDSVFDEESKPGNDFLAQVTKQWEDEVDKINSLGIRVVKIRTGVVLSKSGGALEKMAQPVKFGVGSPLGSGSQYISWIHIDDLCSIFTKAIEDEKMNGAYNAATNWVTNAALTSSIAKTLDKPLWLPNVPAFVLKLILGEMADIVLNGAKVSSERIKNAGFQFKFTNLEDALNDLLIR
jgi:uncharacterized protein (TIGR01777 family)